jgi:hypothetical protein
MKDNTPEIKKTKIDFISDLLKHDGIGLPEKERLFMLIANELHSYDEIDAVLLKEIQLIKEKIGLTKDETIVSGNKGEISEDYSLPDYINPKHNADFLLEYNQNVILKSTTHNIDSNLLQSINDHLNINQYSFDKHLEAIQHEYKKLSNKFYGKTSAGLSGKIYAYLTGTKLWSENKIQMSWGAQDLKGWAFQHPGQCPNPEADLHSEPFGFHRLKLKNGIYITDMCDLVLFFKKQVTIRNDNNLKDLCKEWSFELRDKVDINLNNIPNNVEFFTDIEKLSQAYRRLITLCIEVSPNEKPKVEISLKEIDDKKIIFSILHKNSTFCKTIDATLNRYGSSFTELIKNQLNGLCDFRLRADFGDKKFALITLWPKVRVPTMIERFEGVQYELIFNY